METVVALVTIFRDNILPLLLLMALGFWLQRKFGLDMKTLSRVNMWVFVPALAVWALSQAELSPADLFRVAGFVVALQVCLYAAAFGFARLRGYRPSLAAAFCCALIFYNSGNYGYPLIALLFGEDSPAVGLQAIVLAVQNATTFSLGQVIIRGPQVGVRGALIEYLKMPFLYALILGLTLQQTQTQLPPVLAVAVEKAAGGLVPVALITLGAQLGLVRWDVRMRSVVAAAIGRLIGGPLIALGLLRLLGWQGLLAQQLLISSTVPTAVNTTILAIEFDSEPDFAAQVVMLTTFLSAVTVTLFVYLAQRLYPF